MPQPDGFESVGDIAERLIAGKRQASRTMAESIRRMLQTGQAEVADDPTDPRGKRWVFHAPEEEVPHGSD